MVNKRGMEENERGVNLDDRYVTREFCDERSCNVLNNFNRVESKLDKILWLLITTLIGMVAYLLKLFIETHHIVDKAIAAIIE